MSRKTMAKLCACAVTCMFVWGAVAAQNDAAAISREAGVTKPAVIQFGDSFHAVYEKVREQCLVGLIERMNQPIELPTVRDRQTQIDCIGFWYNGKPRKVRFKFADDILDLVVIETAPEDQDELRSKLVEEYGEPSRKTDDEIVFLESGVALDTEQHAVVYFSDRLKESYGSF